MTARGKYVIAITLKVDDELAARIDAIQRSREAQSGVPLSRGLTARLLLEEHLGLREAVDATAAPALPRARARE